MHKTAVVIGLGQLGREIAGGLLRTGFTVCPVNRGDDLAALAEALPEPGLVLVAVGENDLHPVLSELPAAWREDVVLLQNELLPRDWQAHDLETPSVLSVWFEKKRGTDAKALLPSPAYGPHAAALVAALRAIELPAREVVSEAEMRWELVRKNLYILTSNIAGLDAGGTVGELWRARRGLAEAVAGEVLQIQSWLCGEPLEVGLLMQGMLEAFDADPAHNCAGRSAPMRLQRALHHADVAGVAAPVLKEIAARHGVR